MRLGLRTSLFLNNNKGWVDHPELAGDVLDVGLNLCIYHYFFIHSMPGDMLDDLFLSASIEMLHLLFVHIFVEVIFVESDDFVDVSVLFL